MELGFIAQVKDFKRFERPNGARYAELRVDPGGGPNVTPSHSAPPGYDAQPLPGFDYAVAVSVKGTGRSAVVGYVDTLTEPETGPGEIVVYARDPSTGLRVSELYLGDDGRLSLDNLEKGAFISIARLGDISLHAANKSVAITNNNGGEIKLKNDGSVTINGATISLAGEITNAAGTVLGTHTHGGGSPPD